VTQPVWILGTGMVPFGKHQDVKLELLAGRAAREAIGDAGVDKGAVDEVFFGSSYGGPLVGQRTMRDVGLAGLPITNVENACSSGATALRDAVAAIRSGRMRTGLVVGADNLTRFAGGTIPLEATDLEVNLGVVMPAVYAMRAQRYLAETPAGPEDLAEVSVKARRNGADNPYAQTRSAVDRDEVLASRMVADPLTLLMCCPTGDGAAAVVVTGDEELARRHGGSVEIAASVLASGRYNPGYKDISVSELTRRTAAEAYAAAGLTPQEVDVFEVHDAFAIAELMYYEALGLCGVGEARELLADGHTARSGPQPVNPGGGLLSRGHPIGATGLAQICESVWQLRGSAGPVQVDRPARTALTHCTGGGITGLDHGACAVHILVAA